MILSFKNGTYLFTSVAQVFAALVRVFNCLITVNLSLKTSYYSASHWEGKGKVLVSNRCQGKAILTKPEESQECKPHI